VLVEVIDVLLEEQEEVEQEVIVLHSQVEQKLH
jgi:hypothetical protein